MQQVCLTLGYNEEEATNSAEHEKMFLLSDHRSAIGTYFVQLFQDGQLMRNLQEIC